MDSKTYAHWTCERFFSDVAEKSMRTCCKYHLTGGDAEATCEDRDAGQVIVGEPLGPLDDEDIDDDESESEATSE
jgi:hypothetical protein